MATGKSWTVDLRAGSAAELKDAVAASAISGNGIPLTIQDAIFAAIDALPIRADLGVMVNTSGRLESWEEYTAQVDALPQAQKDAGVLPPKPSGFMSIWVGHTNGVQRTVVS